MIETREAHLDDADAIATVHVEGWRVAYRGFVRDDLLDDPEFLRLRHERWTRRLRDGSPATGDNLNTVFVVLAGGQIVGFGHVGREARPPDDHPGRGEIYAFYVHPDHWGTGASDELMRQTCLPELRSRFESAVLWTLRDNPRSRRFYERHGWTCGAADENLIDTWEGLLMPGLPPLSSPLHNIQYRTTLD